jgi:hypothetical protein
MKRSKGDVSKDLGGTRRLRRRPKGHSRGYRLARRYGAELHLISVIEELPKYAAMIDEVEEVKAGALRHYQAIQEEACRQAEQRGVKAYDAIIPGHEVQTIVQQAE